MNRPRLEAAGVTVSQIDIELGTEDFVPILSRIQARAEAPDAIRIVVTGETSFNLTQQMAELGIAPTPETICVTNQIAFQHVQYWQTVPDGNYCAFNRVGIIPSLFNGHRHRSERQVRSRIRRYRAELWHGVL